uniref:Uncharacterized protein n=1 Tax=Chenopodium quinoa TaxID=63459 RepID=A0A803MV78_CHEQI
MNTTNDQITGTMQVRRRGRPSKKPTTVDTPGSGSNGKRSRDEDGESTPNTPTSGDVLVDEFVPRPVGAKKVNSRLKGKEVTTQALDTFESFGDKLKLYDKMRDKAVDIEMQQYKMNWDMLQQLLAKEVRAPWVDQMIIELQEYLSKFRAF